MSWIEVRASIPEGTQDTGPIVDAFLDFGIENTAEDGETIYGCLPNVPSALQIVGQLVARLEGMGLQNVVQREFEEENWESLWRIHFKPRKVGNRFLVCPTWELEEPTDGRIVIVLDPGQAFGTGDHPTTRLCLELMEEIDLSGGLVADVGCGSGILAVGAVKLGAAKVEALDIDPIAVEVAEINAKLNGVEFPAFVGEGVRSLYVSTEAETLARATETWEQDETPLADRTISTPVEPEIVPRYDVVVSNIISLVLIRIAADAYSALLPGGAWIVSGVIPDNWPDVLRRAEEVGFRLMQEKREDGWVGARFQK